MLTRWAVFCRRSSCCSQRSFAAAASGLQLPDIPSALVGEDAGSPQSRAHCASPFPTRSRAEPCTAAHPAPAVVHQSRAVNKNLEIIEMIGTLRSEEKHEEVIALWNSLKDTNPSILNNKILALLVSSASKLNDQSFIVDIVPLAMEQGLQPEQGTLLSFMRACREDELGGWVKAVSMLEKIKGNSALNSPIYEEVVMICFSSGKWRRALNVLNQMLQRNIKLSEKVQNYALKSCANVIDQASLTAAYELFKNAINKGMEIETSVYAALISGFSEAGLHNEAEHVWRHVEEGKLPVTDSIYAARISQLSHSGRADKAPEVFSMSLALKHKPQQSINKMTNLLLKAGKVEEACAYLKEMKELRKVKLSSQLVEYHVKALAQGGHIPAAVKFLQHWKVFQRRAFNWNFERAAQNRIWRELFNDCILLGKLNGAEMVFRRALSSKTVDTSGWLSRLMTEVGEAGQSRHLLYLSKRYPVTESTDMFSLVRAMCICHLFLECLDLHQTEVVEAARPELGASHLLAIVLCRQDMWREAKMVIKDTHKLCGNRSGCLPALFSRTIQISGRTMKGRGKTTELWQLQRELACRPTWNCARYAIMTLFMECRWEECLDIFQSRQNFTDYHPHRLDQKTMTRVIRAYGHLERWMDAVEIFADFVEEKLQLSKMPAGRPPVIPGKITKSSVNIDFVMEIVLSILSQYDQESLIPIVLTRVVEKGIPLSETILKEAFAKTATDNVTATLNIHRKLFRIAVHSKVTEATLAKAYQKATKG